MDGRRTLDGNMDEEFGEVLHLLRSLPSAKFEVLARSMHFDSPAAARDFFCINPHLFHVSLISRLIDSSSICASADAGTNGMRG